MFSVGAIKGTAVLDTSGWDSNIKSLSKGVAGFVAGGLAVLSAGMIKATLSADKWQQSLSNVNTLLDTSSVDTQAMAKGLLQLDSRLGSTTSLTEAMYQSLSAGASSTEEAMATVETSAKFAKAALTDTATAVDVLTTAQNAYGVEVVNAEQASDIFFTTIKQGKINGEQLSSSIGKSIPLFASLNIPLTELGSGMATMTKQGISASESTTQLNGIVNSFLKPSASMSAALEAQGYASGSALLETEGLSGALGFLETASGGSKDELSKLLPSVEAVRGTLALTGKGGEEFTAILEEMGNATGATDVAFEKQEMTLDTLKNSMGKLELVAGNIGKYFLDDIAGGATKASEAMTEFLLSSDGAEKISSVIGFVAGAFNATKVILTPLIETILPTLRDKFMGIKDELAQFTEGSTSTIGAMDILGGISQFLASTFNVLGSTTNFIVTNLFNLAKVVTQAGGAVGSFFSMLKGETSFADFKEEISGVGGAIEELAGDAVRGFGSIVDTIAGEVVSFGDKAISTGIEIQSAFIETSNNTKANILENFDELTTGQQALAEAELAAVAETSAEKTKANTETQVETISMLDKLKKAWASYGEKITATYDASLQVASFTMESMSTITALETQNQLDSITLKYYEDTDALDAKLAAGIISETEYDNALAVLDAEKLAKENEVNEKAFNSNKSLQIAGVAMDTAKSVSSWWSTAGQLGPIAGPIFAGVMSGASIAMGIKQASLISDQQYVPAREKGGLASGLTRINEAGGEIVTLPDGSQVIPNDISRQIASETGQGSLNQNINISFEGANFGQNDPEEIADVVSRVLSEKMREAV